MQFKTVRVRNMKKYKYLALKENNSFDHIRNIYLKNKSRSKENQKKISKPDLHHQQSLHNYEKLKSLKGDTASNLYPETHL